MGGGAKVQQIVALPPHSRFLRSRHRAAPIIATAPAIDYPCPFYITLNR